MQSIYDRSVFLKLKKIARSGNSEQMWQLGVAYRDGRFECIPEGRVVSIRRNSRLARMWLENAAHAGSVGAMIDLAAMFYEWGLKKAGKNRMLLLQSALYWELKAWHQGESFVAGNIALTYSALQKRKLCFKWFSRNYAVNREDLVYIGLCLAIGYGVRRDEEKARMILSQILGDLPGTSDDVIVAKKMLWMLDRSCQILILDPISDLYRWIRECSLNDALRRRPPRSTSATAIGTAGSPQ